MSTIEDLRTIKESTVYGIPELTTHSKKHKMYGIQSLSTSVLLNPICAARRDQENSVCKRCYANKLTRVYPALSERLARNSGILTSHRIMPHEIPRFTTCYGRIESFGDVANVTQAKNYIDIINANSMTQFGIWSKNFGLWQAAFDSLGKPKNCTFVASSKDIDKRADIPNGIKEYTDHIFTVWSKGHESNCAGISCIDCLKCYKKDTEYYIDEIIR